ncbi:type I restriction endonuclease subunit R [Desulfocastanea catecholica]
MITDINNEDRLVQATFAEHLARKLGWESIYAWNEETFGPDSLLGRADTREVVLKRDLGAAITLLNPQLPVKAVKEAVTKLTHHDFSRALPQHNQAFYKMIRDGVPVSYRDANNTLRHALARLIDFREDKNNRFLAVRELKITGLRSPNYNRRADLICFVNGLPLVFIELKAVYKNIRGGFEGNLKDYLDEHVIAHAFHHNAFLVVSNGHRARYGSITSEWEHFGEWKRLDERDTGSVEAEVLLNGMLAKKRLLDIVENFILFDASKPGAIRKVVARNHQLLGVNRAMVSVFHQEELKKQFPPDHRLTYRVIEFPREQTAEGDVLSLMQTNESSGFLNLPEPAHRDLGKLGVFWHTQGSGKSYSMAFFAEKVRRIVPGNFTFVVMTDRNDLDGQIYRTFVGCGVADDQTPRASSGKELAKILQQNHRYVFSLIHKFNQDIDPEEPYSRRDDIIVISDEAHRTQAGKMARNMRLALPNGSFIGFTGTPLFKHDQLTKRIFGDYVSCYDFKRSEEDGATVKLVYENRGEKLGLTRLDLNDRIADAIAIAELNQDQEALLERLLGKDYEVITADDRLEKIAADFVEHAATRWESGKSMLVCVDKITCGRIHTLIMPLWRKKLDAVQMEVAHRVAKLAYEQDEESRKKLKDQRDKLLAQVAWLQSTIIEIIISEAQNEVADFKKWDFDIIPHRLTMKQGFETADGKKVDVESAFKNPEHPFRIAIVCAMWLTGFDVECLSALYIDKPMKAHTLMQAIARANRRYPGKDFGLIVDYNGMLKSLREALAQYALGDEGGEEEVVAPIEERVKALLDAIEETETHLLALGFDSQKRLVGAKGFTRIQALADAVDVVYTSDETKRRFEILARQVFIRFKGLLMEPSALLYAERHDNIEAIYKKLTERRDTADVTILLKALHRIVNEAIRAQSPVTDEPDSRFYDLSTIDLEKLRNEFASKVRRKATALQDIRELVEAKLAQMIARNPMRMDYYKRYQEIIADYNREKDRVSIEETFAKVVDLMASLDDEQRRAVEEGLSEEEYALFCLLQRDDLSKTDREQLKQVSQKMLKALQVLLGPLEQWTQKEQTQAEVEIFILDQLYEMLPSPPYSEDDKQAAAKEVYSFIWNTSASSFYSGAAVA